MIKQGIILTEIPRSSIFVTRGHERSNEKNKFSKTKIYFHKKTTPKLLGYIGLQTMKVGVKSNIGRLATIFQICAMDANILCYDKLVIRHLSRDLFPYLVIK